jgi:hypothetical protein
MLEGPDAPPPPSCRCHACKSVRRCPCSKSCHCAVEAATYLWKQLTPTEQIALANNSTPELEVLRGLLDHAITGERYLHQQLGGLLTDRECPEALFDRLVAHHRGMREMISGMVEKFDALKSGLLTDAGEGAEETGEAALVSQGRVPPEVSKTGALDTPDLDADTAEILSRYGEGLRRRPEEDEDLELLLRRYRWPGRSSLDESDTIDYGGH